MLECEMTAAAAAAAATVAAATVAADKVDERVVRPAETIAGSSVSIGRKRKK